ncbi:MAG: orotate phosphoribosyltransferase [Bacteroidales bacterium]|nr:orotate phosphoribosyltransferase [Bacteroidales bacterium]
MEKVGEIIGKNLLQINAIKLEPANPFTWASGWKSPIYCDNRKTLSYPEIRNYIRDQMVKIIRDRYPDVDVIAGVAAGAIAQGVLVAQELGLPFVYVRSSQKQHGLENLVEGVVKPGQKVVVIEDLISTGSSSLKAVTALRNTGCEVKGLVAIFTYGFLVAAENFKKANCEWITLSNYNIMIDMAYKSGFIKKTEIEALKSWKEDPGNWNPAGFGD